jgi:hypothetical protein
LGDAVAFDVEFLETRRFPAGAVYLTPEPPGPFVDLTRRVWGLFPDWPPYGGEFLPDITPHLTIAWGALLDEAEAAVAAQLTLHTCVREALLLTEIAPAQSAPSASFPFRAF